MNALPHRLDRDVLIRADRDLVFRFFTDSERFARWWGEGSRIDPQVGGEVRICYPGGVVALGSVLALEPPQRIVFSYGYERGEPIGPGSSRVEITLREVAEGTSVHLQHDFADANVRDHHRDGWRYHLSVFAHVAAEERHRCAAAQADCWFAAWAEADAGRRDDLFRGCAVDDVEFCDPYSAVRGRAELSAHVGNAQRHMPGVRMQREGELLQCQGTALVEWHAVGSDGSRFAGGSHVFEFGPDGRIKRAVGLWRAQG